MSSFFELKTSNDLYKKAKNEYENFCKDPNDYDSFNLVTSLYHLREWICPIKYNDIKKKPLLEWNKEEKLYVELFDNSNFIIIQSLCNNSKHFKDDNIAKKSKIRNGFIFGTSKFGDKFNQRNYIVDGKDLRSIINEVFKIYDKYFEENNS